MINKNDLRKAISSIAISNAKRNTIYKAFSDLPSISKEEFDSVKSDISKVVESMLTKDTVGKANGVASLDSNGSVPIKQLGNIDTTLFLIVRELPTTDIKTNKIYLVPNKDSQGNNVYIEYLYVDNVWENLGEVKTEVDLSEYVNKNELTTIESAIQKQIAIKANAQDVTNAIGELQDKIGDRIVVSGNVINNPDDEDITTEGDTPQTQVLKLKDRAYDSLNASGKGYKILRKNWQTINGVRKNVLTQEMINEPNTIYEIRYDFDLNGAEIDIPENCILKFEGGSLNNGVLHGNRIAIKSSIEKIFQKIEFDENFFLNSVCPEWFGVIQNVDCSTIIQYLLDKKCNIEFGVGTYLLSNLIIMSSGTSICGQYSNTILNCAGIYMNVQTNIYDIQLMPISHEIDFLICISNQYVTASYARIGIRNIYAKGLKNKETNTSIIDFKINRDGYHSIDIDSVRSDGYFGYGIKIYSQNIGWLTNLRVSNCFFYAARTTIDINADLDNIVFQDLKFTNVESQYNANFTENFVKIGSISRTIFDGCVCWDSTNKIDTQYYVYNDNTSISIVNEVENAPINNLIKTKNGKVGLQALLSHVISYSTLSMTGLNIMKAKSFSNNEQIINEDTFKTLNGWIAFNTDKPYSATEPYAFRGLRLTNIDSFSSKRSDTLIGMSGGDKPCCGTVDSNGVNLWFIYSEKFIPYCNENDRGVGRCIGHLKYDTTIHKPIWWNKTLARWETSDGNSLNVKNYGTFTEKPTTAQGISIGFAYFCTDKQSVEGATNGVMIYHKGNNVWVDALGRTVS